MPKPAPLRIVSLAPSATDILVSIGARRHLVGVSKWCKDVADVHGLPVLGDCWSLDPDAVVALNLHWLSARFPSKPKPWGSCSRGRLLS